MPDPSPPSDTPAASAVGGAEAGYGLRQWTGWVLGPALLLLTLIVPAPEGLSPEGWRTAGVALLMATFWISEAIPLPATALIPLVAFPLLQLGGIQDTAAPYANPIVFLFLGGFVLALAMQRWNLHRRVALGLIGFMGAEPKRIVAGFLGAGALLSMWVSNTATALMMLPIALSVVALLPCGADGRPRDRAFATALLLAVAYGATAGGMATLIGTPPNALLAAYLGRVYDFHLGFGQWMLLGVPVTLLTLPAAYCVLTRLAFRLQPGEVPGMAALMAAEKARMGPLSRAEWSVLIVFLLTASGWIFQPLLARALPLITDTSIAIAGALLLFMIPLRGRGEFVMDWKTAQHLPWEVLLLFGGGLSLAGNIQKHGLSSYLGELCGGLQGVPTLAALAVICFGILLLTELTSNTATAATFLPIVAAVALSLGQSPLLFLIPTALAANCSFMMPVGTPPNVIVFGSGHITLPQMVRAGWWLNLILVPIVIGVVLVLGPFVFDLRFDTIPAWVR
jgi:sodium-dependent dicarboxylate transporter 2/3/5